MIKYKQILVFNFILFNFIYPGFSNQYHFNKIDNNDGLSNNHVQAILKDNQGFMWFGTMNGLNRYDGYSIKTFKHIPGDSTSIISNDILNLFMDEDYNIWVETTGGLCIYNSEFETFNSKNILLKNKYYIPNINTANIIIDKNNNTWIAHYSNGLYCYNKGLDNIARFEHNSEDTTTISSNSISSIGCDSKGNIWLVYYNGILEKFDPNLLKITYRISIADKTYQENEIDYRLFIDKDDDIWFFSRSYQIGLYYFNTKSKHIIIYNNKSKKYKTNNNLVTSVIQADNGEIWCGTDHGGINIINKKNYSTKFILNSPYNENSLCQDVILKLFKDNDGIIWIGTYKKGVDYYHESFNKFKLITNNPEDNNSLPYNDVNCFTEDDKSNLWIGTNGEGLIYYDRKNKKFTQYKNDPNKNSLSSNVIVSLFFDKNNQLWIGTFHGGLNILKDGKFKIFMHDADDLNSISSNHVWKIFKDSKENTWIGTLGGGLELFNPELNKFTHFTSDDVNSVQSDGIFAIYEDSKNNLWIGTR